MWFLIVLLLFYNVIVTWQFLTVDKKQKNYYSKYINERLKSSQYESKYREYYKRYLDLLNNKF